MNTRIYGVITKWRFAKLIEVQQYIRTRYSIAVSVSKRMRGINRWPNDYGKQQMSTPPPQKKEILYPVVLSRDSFFSQ